MTTITTPPLFITTAFDTPQFAQHQRNDWDQSFAHLFDSKLDAQGSQSRREIGDPSPRATTADSESTAVRMGSEQDQQASSFEPFEIDSAEITVLGRPSSMADSDMSPGQAEGEPTVSLTSLRETDEPFFMDQATIARSDSAVEVTHSDVDFAAPVVVIGLTADDAVRISVRSNELTTHDWTAFLFRLRSELSWKGFSLDRLSANGKIAFSRSSVDEQN